MSFNRHYSFLDVGEEGVLHVGTGYLVADTEDVIRFEYSHSGLTTSTLYPGKIVKDSVHVIDGSGQPFAGALIVVGSELRNLDTGGTIPASAGLRPGRTDIVDVQVQAPPAALESSVYELRTVLEYNSIRYEHARIYTTLPSLQTIADNVKRAHAYVTADRYVVADVGGFTQYLVEPGTGDYQTGVIIAAQDLFDVDGVRIDDIADFHAQVVHR